MDIERLHMTSQPPCWYSKYSNMAAVAFVELVPGEWVQTIELKIIIFSSLVQTLYTMDLVTQSQIPSVWISLLFSSEVS
jgi:hypothetical protein